MQTPRSPALPPHPLFGMQLPWLGEKGGGGKVVGMGDQPRNATN